MICIFFSIPIFKNTEMHYKKKVTYKSSKLLVSLTVLIWGCERTQGSFRESMPANTNT